MQALSGKTNIVGLIGWPVSHSVSPPMHNAAFAALGLDWFFQRALASFFLLLLLLLFL